MKTNTMLRGSIVAWLVGSVGAVACTDPGPVGPEDAGIDAGGAVDAAPPDGAMVDAALPDATLSDATLPDATLCDAAQDGASDAGDASSADASSSDAGDASSADAGDASSGDAGDASSADAGSLPTPFFAPGESGAAYTMTATCAITAVNRVGTVGSCCRTSTYTLTTTCDTSLREEPDGAGSLRAIVDPMTGCATALSGEGCTRSGELPRCDGSNLLCPYHTPSGGDPSLVVGTYARALTGPWEGPFTPVDHYWIPGCPSGPTGRGDLPANVCTPPGLPGVDANGRILTTLARTGPGAFSIRRSWSWPGTDPACGPPQPPMLLAPLALARETFASGSGNGGTFYMTKYTCTYTLAKK